MEQLLDRPSIRWIKSAQVDQILVGKIWQWQLTIDAALHQRSQLFEVDVRVFVFELFPICDHRIADYFRKQRRFQVGLLLAADTY